MRHGCVPGFYPTVIGRLLHEDVARIEMHESSSIMSMSPDKTTA
jgi:hypothetical protein